MKKWPSIFLYFMLILSFFSCKKRNEVETSEVQSKNILADNIMFLGRPVEAKSVTNLKNKIYKNEAKSSPDYLVFWSEREDFPSLGIAHWIWFPQFPANFNKSSLPTQEDTFPGLLRFLASRAPKLGVEIPEFLRSQDGQVVSINPFKNRIDFMNRTAERDSLKKFLMLTMDLQTQYLIKTVSDKVERAIKSRVSDESEFRAILLNISGSAAGIYPIFDYVNFKGDGTDTTWGLLQVLDRLKGKISPTANHFSQACIETLKQRVVDRPKDKAFLAGWISRCESYH